MSGRDALHRARLAPLQLIAMARRSLLLLGSAVLLLYLRMRIMGAKLPHFTAFDNPAAAASFPARPLTWHYLLAVNAQLLLSPAALCCDWTMGTVPLLHSLLDARNLCTLLLWLVLLRLAYVPFTSSSRSAGACLMALSLLVFPFVPASNFFFPVGFVVAERVLYMPSMGFSLLVASGYQLARKRCHRKTSVLLQGCLIFLIATHSIKTIQRSSEWNSEYSLFRAALRVTQSNAKVLNNVGHALESKHDYPTALRYFRAAAQTQPDDLGSHINVGRTYVNLNQTARAEAAFRTGLALLPPVIPGKAYTTRIAPNHLNIFVNLGNLLVQNGNRLQEAEKLYRQAISMRPDFVKAYMNLGDILLKFNRVEEARATYKKALSLDPDNADLHYNLGVVLLQLNEQQAAFDELKKALQLQPKHKLALFNSGILLMDTNDPKHRPDAIARLQKVLDIDPSDSRAHFNLGMMAMDDNRTKDARDHFMSAVKIRDDFRSALFNLALLLNNDMNKPLDAMPYLEKLLKYHPDHVKGWMLQGEIHINVLKDLPAAQRDFEAALQLDPQNLQAQHNLCVVLVERGELDSAEHCLLRATELAPSSQYVQTHLGIVRKRLQAKRKSQAAKHSHQDEQKSRS